MQNSNIKNIIIHLKIFIYVSENVVSMFKGALDKYNIILSFYI